MKPDRIQFAPAESSWDFFGQRIEQTYSLPTFALAACFGMFVTALAEVRASSTKVVFVIVETDVTVGISRLDGGDLTAEEQQLAEAVDALHELIAAAPAPED